MIPSLYHRAQVETTAAYFNLDPQLLLAQVLVESSGRADAFRYEPAFYAKYVLGKSIQVGATHLEGYGPLLACSFGLLQILLVVAYEQGFLGRPEELFQPEVGLEWGARYLKRLLDWAKGNESQALAAYNGGKGGNEAPPYRNTDYVQRVYRQRDLLATPSGVLNV